MFRSRRLVAYAACAAVLFSLLPRGVDGAPRNRLMEPSTLPFGAPPFDKITDADYLPAYEAGMARQRREVDYGPMFRSFYGKDPQVGPLLLTRGLIGPSGG